MTKEEILEGNKLIAEFMGAIYVDLNDYGGYSIGFGYKYRTPPTNNSCYNWTVDNMLYYYEWNWIKPVFDKLKYILLLNENAELSNTFDEIINGLIYELAYSKIEIFFANIVTAIKWYNKNKTI